VIVARPQRRAPIRRQKLISINYRLVTLLARNDDNTVSAVQPDGRTGNRAADLLVWLPCNRSRWQRLFRPGIKG
jgi:hypothetical protein